MGLLAGMEWPEALTGTLEAVVDRIPAEALAHAAARIPEFATGGFRVAGAKEETLRRRAVQLLRSSGEVPEPLRRLVVAQSLQGKVVAILSADVLLRRREELEACLGDGALLLGMLLDGRERVRKSAAERLVGFQARQGEGDPSRAKAAVEAVFAGLFDELVPVLERVARDEGTAEAELPNTQKQRIGRLEDELRRTQERAGRVGGLEAKVAKLEETVKELRLEVDQWRATAEERAREAALARTQVAQLRTALTEQGEGRERDIVDGVAARLADETFAWLREAKEAADMAGDGAAQDVVERARALLERQRALDRRTGTLATLRGRLEELAALEVALLRAQADALNPLPELATVAAQIDSEMARIARVPGVVADPGCGTVAQTLLARLGTADESGLEGVERVVAELERIGLLSEHERVCLRRARRDRLAQRLAREHAEEGRGRRQESAEALRQEWQRVTGSADGATLLVDGHNLLLNPELPYAVEAEAGSSGGERARGALVRDVVWVVSMLPNADARVFFDGPDAQERAGGAGVLVVFSGGSGENRADDRIVDYLHFRATQPRERRVVLVSEDRELRARSRKEDRKSVLLSAAQFDVLRRLASKRRLHATPPNQTHV